MISENQKIEPTKEKNNIVKVNKNINSNNNTTTTEVIKYQKEFIALINYQQYPLLSDSIINYMAIISLFVYGCII